MKDSKKGPKRFPRTREAKAMIEQNPVTRKQFESDLKRASRPKPKDCNS